MSSFSPPAPCLPPSPFPPFRWCYLRPLTYPCLAVLGVRPPLLPIMRWVSSCPVRIVDMGAGLSAFLPRFSRLLAAYTPLQGPFIFITFRDMLSLILTSVGDLPMLFSLV